MNREINFPVLLKNGERVYTIEGYIGDISDYREGRGYVQGDDIFIYTKDVKLFKPSNKIDEPIFRIIDGDISYRRDLPVDVCKVFNVNNIVDLSLKRIMKESEGIEQLYSEDELNEINVSSDMFIPVINDRDDFLKKIIKESIINKGINIKVLQHKFHDNTKYALSNMRSALIGDTKMSVDKFIMWVELLGLDFTVSVKDNGLDRLTPLTNQIVYDSKYNSIK